MPQLSNNKCLMFIRSSRKGYILEYACAAFVFTGLALLALQGKNPVFPIKILGYGVGLAALASAEIPRALTRYKIHETKLTVIKGLIKQSRRHIYFHPLGFVPDLNVDQGTIGRFLGIGTVYLKGSDGENTFELKNVNKPHEILRMIEELIDANKGNPTKSTENITGLNG